MDDFKIDQLPGDDNEVMNFETAEKMTISLFVISLFQILVQAKMIHFQTDIGREHTHYGMFYDEFNEQMDTIIEAIAGKYGKSSLKFGEAGIMVYDKDVAIPEFFEIVEEAFRDVFQQLFDRERDSELYSLADEVLTLTNKTKYLLQMNP